MKNKCPKTMSGKHEFRQQTLTVVDGGYSASGYIPESIPECIYCGILNDIEPKLKVNSPSVEEGIKK